MKIVIYALHVLVAVCFLPCMETLSFESESLSKYDSHVRCIESERDALLVFRQSVANEYDQLQSWKKEENDCCEWKGVGCDNHTGHVTHLYLSSLIQPSYYLETTNARVSVSNLLLDLKYLNYLDLSSNIFVGIPKFIGSLTELVHLDLSDTCIGVSELSPWIGGSIPEQIGNLSKLQYLNLSNSCTGGPIPKFIGSLHSLKYLDLSNCGFDGVVPHELENLSNLQHLDLSWNYLTPNGNFSWLFNLTSLAHLALSGIDITPPGIWVSFIQRIPSISILRIEGCHLLSPSSTLSNFSSSISALYHRDNLINSSIVYWLSHNTFSLEVLDLHDNMLEGAIPQSFAQLTALTDLNLGQNILSGPIANTLPLMTTLTKLDLSANQLTGDLPKSICNLSRLRSADFSSNNFTGNLEDLLSGHLSHLQELSLYKNQLTGSVPDITLLSSLRELDANSNQLNGYLPIVFKHHSVLQILDLSNNQLRGSLPNFTRFSSLWSLNLSDNQFSGGLPDFTGCSALQVLRLDKNQLTKWETRSTGLLSSLRELDLSMNSIHSTIFEVHLFNLSRLEYIRTSFNSLTFEFTSNWLPPFQLWELSVTSCKLGPKFPNWIRNQQHIVHLDISNSQISDNIPIWFGNLSSIMKLLNLSSNKIRGEFSFNFDQLEVIDLSFNYFNGALPPVFHAGCSKIILSQNKFSGTLQSFSVVEYYALSFLDLSHNKLFGALPDNWIHFELLAFLNLGYNNFSGRIPTSIGHLGSLQTLILRNNKLYGELPASLRNCRGLGFVDFGFNKLSGKVPSWIGKDHLKLYALILKSNRFYGSLPYEICHLHNLHFLDLSINRISGTIPPCFGNFTAMTRKGNEVGNHFYLTNSSVPSNDTDYYVDNVLARWKGQEFEYGRNFAYLKMIDLSTNELTGEIPTAITRLLDLKGLNLSVNRFNGELPQEIGQLKALECLDLSANKFSGEIPQSMSGLTFLGFLDLSNNNFSGKIPSGTQLQGFSISAYEGNTELCGKPLTITCPGDEPTDHIQPSFGENEDDGDDSDYQRWLYVSAVLGFSTTFWGIIGILVLNRRWRHAYFLFLDNLKERLIVAMAVRIARFQRKA
ncbi:hypothetical protein DCAR_0728937 [Daucus carota subsp. sativus]|uniref:Leucine-rich repeat-containing N-terminal plant-type domain-containing protein n=2 Tax=Daucus carota subsp. sativus TaxID=79200 RepID=A0AAF0XJW6_DAUCS|nr:hypothetical protein DCAR_0728937 [Daucus carota subsp. sativus]